ncbi:MAG: L-aspartate oxidase [Patescibacteria group bacterium]
MSESVIERDFLVIGSGLAGLYTALQLAKLGRVALVTKAALEESNTFFAQGGIAAALDPGDSPALHFQDTLAAGAGLCRTEAVEVLVNEGPDRVRELIELGVPFDRGLHGVALTREAAHSRRRILHALGDATGKAISQSLAALVRRHEAVTVWENTMAAALLVGERGCGGALAAADGGMRAFTARATVLCTGGCGQLYPVTTNPGVATGDGIALAYMAGAQVTDMEFMQFHPTALSLPGAPHFLISETVRGEGGVLRNAKGERFMPSYHAQADLAPRDVVARAIAAEMAGAGVDHVWLDLGAMTPERIRTRFPNIHETCRHYGLDITREPIPVAPAAHYMMGGIHTDLWGRSSVPGLFACGEVACTGVHGANRLASNSLLEDLVFAHRIAEHLAREAEAAAPAASLRPAPLPEIPAGITPEAGLGDLRRTMAAAAGITRNGKDLNQAMARLKPAPGSPVRPEAPPPVLEWANMSLVAGLMLQAAFLRSESRGCHYRVDYPEADPSWERRLYFSREGAVEGAT